MFTHSFSAVVLYSDIQVFRFVFSFFNGCMVLPGHGWTTVYLIGPLRHLDGAMFCCSKNCHNGQETRILENCDFITAGKLESQGAKLEKLKHFIGNVRQSQGFGRKSSIILPLLTQLIYNYFSCLHITFKPLSPYIFYFYIVVFRAVLYLHLSL